MGITDDFGRILLVFPTIDYEAETASFWMSLSLRCDDGNIVDFADFIVEIIPIIKEFFDSNEMEFYSIEIFFQTQGGRSLSHSDDEWMETAFWHVGDNWNQGTIAVYDTNNQIREDIFIHELHEFLNSQNFPECIESSRDDEFCI